MNIKQVKIWMLAGLATIFAACSEDVNPPMSIDGTTVTAEPGPGSVTLHWTTPENADYHYVRCTYTLPDGKNCMKSASVYSNSMLIDNLLARYGAINFTLQTVAKDGTAGEAFQISAQADPAEATVEVVGETAIELSADGLFTDSQESSEGPIANLIDGNAGTYFHMSWSSPTPFPHYIVVDLKKSVSAFKFGYTTRNNANNDNPKVMNVWGSNAFDGSYNPESNGGVLIASLDNSVLPSGVASYTSDNYILDNSYQYIWFEITESYSGSNWVALAELSISELEVEINDPEAE